MDQVSLGRVKENYKLRSERYDGFQFDPNYQWHLDRRDTRVCRVLSQRSFFAIFGFLDASSHLYKSMCPSVGPSVGPSVTRL